jgi:hypothetical protein
MAGSISTLVSARTRGLTAKLGLDKVEAAVT